MTQLEKDQMIAELQAKLEEVKSTPVTVHKVWEPDDNTEYVWYGQDGLRKVWIYCKNKEEALMLGMVHPTKEAAERHQSFLVMLHDLHKFAVEHNEGWKPDWNNSNEKFSISLEDNGFSSVLGTFNNKSFAWSILPYFKSRELSQKAIDTFGDRLKILFEYYNS